MAAAWQTETFILNRLYFLFKIFIDNVLWMRVLYVQASVFISVEA